MAHIAADVLCECFVLLNFADRVVATHVCTHWRQAALSRPGALWSHIVSNGTRTGVVRQLFDRAQNVPVKVEILLTDETFKDAMATVSDHLSHIRQLRLFSLVFLTNIHPVYRKLACPAPMLEELEIALRIDDRSVDDFDSDDPDDLMFMPMVLSFDRCIPTDLFAGHAPCLRKAAFHTMELHPDGVPALSGLTRLRFTGSRLPAAQLAAIVSTLPNLRELCIDAQFGYDLPQTPPPAEFRLDELVLASLEMSAFRFDVGLGGLLRYLRHHLTRNLTMDSIDYVGWLDALVDPPRSIPHTLHLYETQFDYCDWEMVDAGGYTSRGRSFQKETLFNALASRDVFARVQTLVLSVTLFSSDIPPLDQLTHLFLYCASSFFMIPGPRESNISCPSLRVLEICGQKLPQRVGKVAIRADDLERFVENLLSSSRHCRVVLRNVSLNRQELLQDQSFLDTLCYSDEPLEVPAALQPNGLYRKWHLWIEE